MADDETRIALARLHVQEGDRMESAGVHYSPAQWRNQEGGFVGHANWRGRQSGQGTTSYCGHKHRTEEAARVCIDSLLAAAGVTKEGS